MTEVEGLPTQLRVSVASAILLGLTEGALDAKPTTIYLLTYRTGRCLANCSFCAQARSSTSKANMLSRVFWPVFPSNTVIDRLRNAKKNGIQRICIQAMNYPEVFEEILGIIRRIRVTVDIPISISCQPITLKQVITLKDAGIDRVGIPLDVPTKKLFKEIKGIIIGGPYVWERSVEALRSAVQVLGRGRVSTHFIVGLGENDEELILMIQNMVDIGVYPALFAFTPLHGTKLEDKNPPKIERYRCIQLVRFLIATSKARFEDIVFDELGKIRNYNLNEELVRETVNSGDPFITSGCPGCNRPFYNERAGGPLYNYPRPLSEMEINEAQVNIQRYLNG